MLKVTLNKIVPRAYATNFNVPGLFGQFPSVYADGQVKYLYLDLDKMQTEFLPGIVLPLRPFPGTLAVARKEPGRYSSVPPGEFAGNMDIRDFVAGTSLYVPVHVPGALLWTGDSHAGQGNGEVNLTAIETAYRELNLTVEVIKGKPLDFPRIETPKSWITMGFDQDLNKAWAQTKEQTVKFLAEQRKVSAAEAEKLMASISDCRVSQVVNVKKGIHCLNPKNARDKEDMERPTKETAKYLRLARQGRGPEQGDERRLDGHDQASRNREEDRPARCLWARQRGDGLPRRRGLRRREERALPDAEEHLGRQALTQEWRAVCALRRCSSRCVSRSSLVALGACARLRSRRSGSRSSPRRPTCAAWPRRSAASASRWSASCRPPWTPRSISPSRRTCCG